MPPNETPTTAAVTPMLNCSQTSRTNGAKAAALRAPTRVHPYPGRENETTPWPNAA